MSITSQNRFSQKTRILAWNVNGLLVRKRELEAFLTTEHIDVALISETHLTSRQRAPIRNYEFYQCNHPSGASHGGTAIYVRKNLQHHTYSNFCTEKIQAAVITVKLSNGSHANVAAIYCPPRHNIDAAEYADLFTHLGPKWLAGGGGLQCETPVLGLSTPYP